MEYDKFKKLFIDSLEKEIEYHITGNFKSLGKSFDLVDEKLPRNAGNEFDKLHLALKFWVCWIDCRNHEWEYYSGIEKDDWPKLAKTILKFIEKDHDINDEFIISTFGTPKKIIQKSKLKFLKTIILSFLVLLILISISYCNAYFIANKYLASLEPELSYVDSNPFYAKLPSKDSEELGWCFRYSKEKGESRYYHNIELYISIFGNIISTNPIDLEKKLRIKNPIFDQEK